MMSVASMKVPAVVVSGVISLCLGAAITYFVMLSVKETEKQAQANPGTGENAGKDAAPTGGSAKMGKAGGKGGGAGGGGKGPNSKMQLTQLVSKLEVLTEKQPLTLQLTSEQKKEAKEILAGLDTKEELTEDEAKSKLDALLKLLESQKETFEKVGYRWPGQPGGMGGGGGGGGTQPPNPFKSESNAALLKTLQTNLDK